MPGRLSSAFSATRAFRTSRSRRISETPYRSYGYTRSRPTPSARDSAFRMPGSAASDDRSLVREDAASVTPELTGNKLKQPKSDVLEGSADIQPVVSPVPDDELSKKLQVINIDLHIETNTSEHHTSMYERTEDVKGEDGVVVSKAELVVRRGKPFYLTIHFDRPYNIAKNDITLLFTLGDDSDRMDKYIKLDETKSTSYKPKDWRATLVDKTKNNIKVEVFIPASAPVGEWKICVEDKDDKMKTWQYNHDQYIVVLFNPWCKQDWVYLEDEAWLNEAILNDSGVLYSGSFNYIGTKAWYYGQFEDVALDASLHLLRKAFNGEVTSTLGHAAKVVRALSKIVNCNDDNGVLVGNWSGDYDFGTPPTSWTGSIKILKEYMSEKRPVCYGQCWVFSGLLTTVCRSLGIPCRSLTNFASAHNTDRFHLSCDVINRRDSEGVWREDDVDSIWNFHVWNEAWMRRPDLIDAREVAGQFDGWQVIDATPQERSDGFFQCGPSPVKAIKEGLLNVGEDTPFIFAEVNGDKVEWREDPKTKRLMQIKRIKNAIGKKISTHKPTGKPYKPDALKEIYDLTKFYKYPEGSPEERNIVRKAERAFRFGDYDSDDELEPQIIEIIQLDKVTIDDTYVGSPFDFKVYVRNRGDVARTVSVAMDVFYSNYRGISNGTAASLKEEVHVIPGEKKLLTLTVSVEKTLQGPLNGYNFKLVAVGEIKGADYVIKESDMFRLRTTELVFKGPESCRIAEEFTVTVSYKNPLKMALTDCKLRLDGNLKCLKPFGDTFDIGVIAKGDTWSMKLRMMASTFPKYIKTRGLGLNLTSKELGSIDGMFYVELIS